MKLSEKIFKEHKFPLVKPTMFNQEQGYDINSVELFLEEIAIEVERIEKENEQLIEEKKMMIGKKEIVDVSFNQTATEATAEEVAAHMTEPLSNVFVDQLKEEYEEKVEALDVRERAMKRMFTAAEEETRQIKKEAQEHAKQILQEAQEKATKLLTEVNMKYKEKEQEIIMLDNSQVELKERLKNIQEYIGKMIN